MKYARHLTIPRCMLDETTTITTLVNHEVAYFKKRQAKKSHVWQNLQVQFFNQDYTNIMEDRVTIVISAKQYKAPRIAFKN